VKDSAAVNLSSSAYEYIKYQSLFSLGRGNSDREDIQRVLSTVDLQPPIQPIDNPSLNYLSTPLLQAIETYYFHRYPKYTVEPSFTAQKFGRLQIFDDQFGSVSSRGHRSSYVTAWKCIHTDNGPTYVKSVGNIHGFLRHKADITRYKDDDMDKGVLSKEMNTTYFAVMYWYRRPLDAAEEAFENGEQANEAVPEHIRAEKDHLYTTIIEKPTREALTAASMERSVIPVTHIIQRVLLSPCSWLLRTQPNRFCAVPLLRKFEG
jgi:hypothetical protein